MNAPAPNTHPPLTYDGVKDTYRECVVVDLGAERDARKKLAKIEDVNARTAKGHYEGDNLPGVVEFLRAAQQLPSLRAWVSQILQLETEFDPNFQVELSKFIRACQHMSTETHNQIAEKMNE